MSIYVNALRPYREEAVTINGEVIRLVFTRFGRPVRLCPPVSTTAYKETTR